MSRIRVRVIKMAGRPSLVAEWKDAHTGKLRRQSTGEKVRREAERVALKLENDLNSGEHESQNVTWEDFRKDYVTAKNPDWSVGTRKRVDTVLNSVELILKPRLLKGVGSREVMTYTVALTERGLSPAGIASCLRHLKAALRWAADNDRLAKVPKITMPKGANEAGGRAITGEERERMILMAPRVLAGELEAPREGEPQKPLKAISEAEVQSWIDTLDCLWNSGLRVGEACKLHWTDPTEITADMGARMFVIAAEASKNGKAQRFPMSVECFQWLSQTPERNREGYVINPTRDGKRIGFGHVVKTIGLIGRRAGVMVGKNHQGKAVYATAHDFRRAFATRWAAKVVPGVLQALMRHASPATTATYYTDRAGDPIVAAIWATVPQDAPTTITGTISTNEKGATTCRK
jgi:integrase